LTEVRDGLIRDGFIVAPLGATEYDKYIRARMQDIQKVAREARIKVD